MHLVKTIAELFTVGRRIRYTGNMANPSGDGAIVGIYDGYLTVALKDGREFRIDPRHIVPEAQERGCLHPYLVCDGYADTIELADLMAGVAMRKASKQAKEDAARSAFAAEVERIRAENPGLEIGGGAKMAAANCRKLLKAAFPGVKFSVRSGRATYSATLDIRWTDGPTTKLVDEIADRFSAGSFDGMEDIYRHTRTPWNETFGSAEYVSTHRSYSDAMIQRAIDEFVAEYAPCAEPAPTVEDYKSGRAFGVSPILNASRRDDWQSLIGRKLAETEA